MSAPAPSASAEMFSALSPASVGGRRRSHKKLRLVKKRTVKRMLKKMGLKMRGGATGEVTADKVVDDKTAAGAVVKPTEGGRRRRRTGRKGKKSRKVFGLF